MEKKILGECTEIEMQKQARRHIVSILISTLLLLSMLVSTVQALTITDPDPITPQNVLVGDLIDVAGTDATPEALVEVYWDMVASENKLKETLSKVDGTFSCEVTIPEDVQGDHWIIVDGQSSRVVVYPKITLTPDTGLLDDAITVAGSGFTAVEEITLEWDGVPPTTLDTVPLTIGTDAKGSFVCNFNVPVMTYGSYTVTATDESGYSDSGTFTIGATIVLDVVEGPSGTIVEIAGRGFTEISGTAVTVTVDTTLAKQVDGIETDSDGKFSGEIVVPTLTTGTYGIAAADENGISSSTVDFEVTGTTAITLGPDSGYPDQIVTIEGAYFTAMTPTEVTVTFVNDTVDYLPSVTIAKTFTTNSTGGFMGTFEVPDHPSLPIRATPYIVNATDENGLYGEAYFRITLEIARASKNIFYVGDTVTFEITSSVKHVGSYIKVWDSRNRLYWTTTPFEDPDWAHHVASWGSLYWLPFDVQTASWSPLIPDPLPLVLLDDVYLGEWRWSWFDASDALLAEGRFFVDYDGPEWRMPEAGVVYVEYISADADYENRINIASPVSMDILSTEDPLGKTVFLGVFHRGTVLEFEMLARIGSGNTYTWSSDVSQNNDGLNHLFTTQVDEHTFLMKWEDDANLGDMDFNDAVMVVHIDGDRDGDGLWDTWETNGVDLDWDGTIDLPIHEPPYNADPDHKDIFVEIDWMADATHSHRPKNDAVNLVIAAFADAPVPNPDGTTGITFHVDISNEIPHSNHLRFSPPAGSGIASFEDVKANHFAPERRSVYHYCLFVHDLGYTLLYSGLAELPGNDFIVSFGGWHSGMGDIDGDFLDDEDIGTVIEQAGTLMHELGHNLDLHHGGADDDGYKPNYVSIMNYFFQLEGIPPTDRLDYSLEWLPSLDENSLDEHLGIQDGTDDTYYFNTTGHQNQGDGDGWIDWNTDGVEEGVSVGTNNVGVDINGDSRYYVSTSYDDWRKLRYLFTDTSDYEDGVHISTNHKEIDFETAKLLWTPKARAGGPYETYEGTAATFDASRSYSLQEGRLRYRWDFDNDGNWDTEWSTEPTDSFTWYDDFMGISRLELTDGRFWKIDSASVTVLNLPPTVEAGEDKEGYVDRPITFSGSFTDPGTEDTHRIIWDFGDGTEIRDTLTPTHTYTDIGSYTAKLTVIDDDGGMNDDTLEVTIQQMPFLSQLREDLNESVDSLTLLLVILLLLAIIIILIALHYR